MAVSSIESSKKVRSRLTLPSAAPSSVCRAGILHVGRGGGIEIRLYIAWLYNVMYTGNMGFIERKRLYIAWLYNVMYTGNKGLKVVYTYVMTVFFSCDKVDFSSTQNSMVDTNLKGRITLIRYLVFEIYTMHVPHSQEEGCHFEWVERREEDINENFEGDALQTCAHLCHCT